MSNYGGYIFKKDNASWGHEIIYFYNK